MRWQWWGVLMACGVTASWAETTIYRCTTDGVTTFSDHACGSDASKVTLDTSRVSTFEAVPIAKVATPKVTRSSPVRETKAAPAKDRCVNLRAQLRSIDDKYRAGYKAKEGVKLDERKRRLKAQARELRC